MKKIWRTTITDAHGEEIHDYQIHIQQNMHPASHELQGRVLIAELQKLCWLASSYPGLRKRPTAISESSIDSQNMCIKWRDQRNEVA